MPGTTGTTQIDVIVGDINGGGRDEPPSNSGGGGDGDPGRRPRKPPQRRYSTAITLGMISILMFFLGLCSAFVILKHVSGSWVPLHLPKILWLNTAILLASSYVVERARHRLATVDLAGFRKLWRGATVLGVLFLAGQVLAWVQLVSWGLHIASNQGVSFFYIFTAAHAVHLLGGVAALLYILVRNFEKGKISLNTAVRIVSRYWHFMDGLWICLLLVLYLGR
jgi:cytochrome c oxidase subunit 3